MKEKKNFYWLVIVGCFLAVGTTSASTIMTFSIFVRPVTQALNIPVSAFVLNMTFITIFAIILAPITGKLIETKGSRVLTIFGGLIMTSGFIVLSFASSLIMIYAGYLILAIGTGIVTPVIATSISVRWFVKRRGLVTGILTASSGFIGMILAPIIANIIKNSNYMKAYLFLAALIFICVVILGGLLIRNNPVDVGLTPYGVDPNTSDEKKIKNNLGGIPLTEALKTRAFWLISISLALFIFGQFSQVQTHNAALQFLGFDPMTTATVVSIYGICSAVTKIIFGFLTDKFPIKVVTLVGMVFGLCGSILLYSIKSTTSVSILYTYAIFVGIGFGIYFPVLSKYVSGIFGPKFFPSILASAFTIGNIFMAFGPFIPSAFYDMKGTYAPAYLLFAILAVISIGVLLVYKTPKIESSTEDN